MLEDIRSLKVLLLGETKVGKTCIIERYVGKEFNTNMQSTIGVSCFYKEVEVEKEKFTLNLWDVAGQEKFHSLTKLYFRGAQGCFIVYDIFNRDSFNKLERWFNKVAEDIPIILVGNKIDIEGKRIVSEKEGKDFTKKKMFHIMKHLLKTIKILRIYLKT